MKNKIVLIMFAFILVCSFVCVGIYVYIQIDGRDIGKNNIENNIYSPDIYKPSDKPNLISYVEPFLSTKENITLFYEGGPVHWGSRSISVSNQYQTDNSKVVILRVVDESDMKGELPKKEWLQKWEAKTDGSLYIDEKLMLKYPLTTGTEWYISEYSPVFSPDKKYTAKVKIISVTDDLGNSNVIVKKIYTRLTIDDVKTVDGGIYTENRTFESGIGLKELQITEPTISGLTLRFWLDRSK